jgi:hypothetical protein
MKQFEAFVTHDMLGFTSVFSPARSKASVPARRATGVPTL